MAQEQDMTEVNKYEYTVFVEDGGNVPLSLEELASWYQNTLPPGVKERVATGDAVVEVRVYTSTADSADAGRLLSEKLAASVSQLVKQIVGAKANIQVFAYGDDASRKDAAEPGLGRDRVVVRVIK